MEQKPEDFMSRDKDGFMHKITDLMDDDDVLVAPGKVVRLKVPVKYVGGNPEKHDNIASTGLTWKNGETLPVDAEAAEKLLRYPDVWAYDPEAIDTYTVAADGSAVLEYHASAEEVTAILEGRAELRVVAIYNGPLTGEQTNAPAAGGEQGSGEGNGATDGDGASNGTAGEPNLFEQVAAMTKAQLIAFASEKFGAKLNVRSSVDELRLQVADLIQGKAPAAGGDQEGLQ